MNEEYLSADEFLSDIFISECKLVKTVLIGTCLEWCDPTLSILTFRFMSFAILLF